MNTNHADEHPQPIPAVRSTPPEPAADQPAPPPFSTPAREPGPAPDQTDLSPGGSPSSFSSEISRSAAAGRSAPGAPPGGTKASPSPRPLNRRDREERALVFNAGYVYSTVIDPARDGLSAAEYLSRDFPHSTPGEWQARLARGEVRIDGQAIDARRLLRAGELVEWHRPGWLEPQTPRQFDILHLDADLLAVDKPSGLPTLPGAGYLDNTLLSLVHRQHPEAHPLHRLGRATSGIVLFARHPAAAAAVSRQWPRLQKIYRALATGVAPRDEYDIVTPIGPQPHPRLGTVHAAHPGGKPSQSRARVVARFDTTTLFEVAILTGRPHQVRIHLASIGHPLVGDPLYGVGGLPLADNPGLPGDPGYFLHAHRLVLDHPSTGARLELTAPPPPQLREPQPPERA